MECHWYRTKCIYILRQCVVAMSSSAVLLPLYVYKHHYMWQIQCCCQVSPGIVVYIHALCGQRMTRTIFSLVVPKVVNLEWQLAIQQWQLTIQSGINVSKICNEASLKPPNHWSKVLCFSAFFLSGFSVRQVTMNDTAKISHYLIITKFSITWRGINHVHNFEMYYITLPRGGALQHPISVPSYGLSRDALGSRYRISCYSYMQGALYCNILRHLTRLFWNDT